MKYLLVTFGWVKGQMLSDLDLLVLCEYPAPEFCLLLLLDDGPDIAERGRSTGRVQGHEEEVDALATERSARKVKQFSKCNKPLGRGLGPGMQIAKKVVISTGSRSRSDPRDGGCGQGAHRQKAGDEARERLTSSKIQ